MSHSGTFQQRVKAASRTRYCRHATPGEEIAPSATALTAPDTAHTAGAGATAGEKLRGRLAAENSCPKRKAHVGSCTAPQPPIHRRAGDGGTPQSPHRDAKPKCRLRGALGGEQRGHFNKQNEKRRPGTVVAPQTGRREGHVATRGPSDGAGKMSGLAGYPPALRNDD